MANITINGLTITATNIRRDAAAYVYKDYGSSYFGDFRHEVECNVSNASGDAAACGCWGISNGSMTTEDMLTNNEGISIYCYYYGTGSEYRLYILDATNDASDYYSYPGGVGGKRYLTIQRVGAITQVFIYTDQARTTLVDTLTVTGATATEYRYVFGLISRNNSSGGDRTITLQVDNLKLNENFNWYVEEDPNGVINRISRVEVRATNVSKQEKSYITRDFGVDYFGDFKIKFWFYTGTKVGDGVDCDALAIAFSNTYHTAKEMSTNNEAIVFENYWTTGNKSEPYLEDFIIDTYDSIPDTLTANTWYYCVMTRIGTTASVSIYSNEAMTTLVHTLSITCNTTKYRYLTVVGSHNAGTNSTTLTTYVKDVSKLGIDSSSSSSSSSSLSSSSSSSSSSSRSSSSSSSSSSQGPYENFQTFSETDPNSDMTVNSQTKVTVATMRRDEAAWLVKDYGAGYFGNFKLEWEVNLQDASDTGGGLASIMLANIQGSMQDALDADDGICANVYWETPGKWQVFLYELKDGTTDIYDSGSGAKPLKWYFTMTRSGTTLTLYIYSDSARTSLIDTLTISCPATTYRYLHAISSREHSGYQPAATITLETENLLLDYASSSSSSSSSSAAP